jgi:hypothetical protein
MRLPVRNAVAIPLRAGDGPGRLHGLFDGDGEPSDQERHFVQMFEIVFLDGTSEPPQALIIAHEGNVGGYNRGHRFQDGLNVWHRITLVNPGMKKVAGD